jgi:tetratricopeptide (TPR) repeat protein
MITARFSSTRSLQIWLTLLLLTAAHSLTPAHADPPAEPAANKDFAGTWRGTINNIPMVWVTDGRTWSTSIEGQPAPFINGTFEAANGHWKTNTAAGPLDEGPFHFIDADTISMTGRAGQEVIWKRAKATQAGGNAAPMKATAPSGQPTGQTMPATGNPSSPSAASASTPVGPGILDDFTELRKQARAAAVAWNSAAELFRVDLWGAYAGSRMKPTGARFLFFSPTGAGNTGAGNGLEVRIEHDTIRTSGYRLETAEAPVAVPETVLLPDEAIRRLWDLAPTVRPDQVYLQLIRPGVEKPVLADGDSEPTSYPLNSFLQNFRAPLKDQETDATKGRLVWRMFALRDHDAVMDLPHGALIAVDALNGAALSKRAPALGVQLYMRYGLTPPSPIEAFEFSDGPIPLDSPAEQVGTFNALAVAQKAESIDLGLRAMVRDGRSDEELRAAIDKLAEWARRIEQVRADDAADGIKALQRAARENPNDLRSRIALFKRYVDEIEREKKRALASPLVTKISPNQLSEFWLPRQFEVTAEGLGTRNQTHMVLDLRSREWLYKMADPPHTRIFSRYLRPAMDILKSLGESKQRDFELERQTTRLNWLVGGNGAALGNDDSLNPIDPLQLMIYAEYNRVRGSENLLSAERLRLPKTWQTTSRRGIGNGMVEVTTTTFTRPPTASELAAADRLDAMARLQEAPRVANVQDLALKLDPLDPRIYYLWSRVEAVFYDSQRADRIALRGLMIDPGCAELHAVRVIAWQSNPKVNRAEVYCADRFARQYTAADLQGGAKLAELDPLAGYFLCLQRLRLAPDDVGSHAILTSVLPKLHGLKINGVEIMPDAAEQRQRELGVGAAMLDRLLDHPDEWSKAVPKGMPATRQNLIKNQVNLLVLRGGTLAALNRKDEARACFKKALALDPGNAEAQKGSE